jgi:hypothetical protein
LEQRKCKPLAASHIESEASLKLEQLASYTPR